MESYKERMIKEYTELKTRYDKLCAMITRYDAGTLDFEPTCSIDILKSQMRIMAVYLDILRLRAEIEKVPLSEE